ncbi:histone-lysine N-methyltransferase SETMAR-like [Cryptotermes secundus]|uniref:histone-lysine N-methyltransferase SETMAR-like n=1 Tax=Cryptotermes secundus TaxID=105785 RepID=UPI000CD7BC7A|nr:histone-lysine N-methyltransferase SETMAR-like [Cryptotermes secundus]
MTAVYQEGVPSYDTVVRWKRSFHCGNTNLEDEPRSGRRSLVEEAGIVTQVEALILSDRCSTIEAIVHEISRSHGPVFDIIHDELHVTKVAVHWKPQLLTPVQKQQWMDVTKKLLQLCQDKKVEFFDCLITMDESWVYHYDPETKEMSKQWKHVDSPPPKKAKSQPSTGKVMLSVFWDRQGDIMTNNAQKGVTITGKYYWNLLRKLQEAIKKNLCEMLGKGVRLLHDNALAHATTLAASLGYEILLPSPFSPVLAPSNFFLFTQLMKPLRGKRFQDVISAVEDFLDSQNETFYNQGIQQLRHRGKCAALEGEYVED